MKQTLSFTFLLFLGGGLFGQNTLLNEMLEMAESHRAWVVEERTHELYLTDSIYCYQRDQILQSDFPVSRQYNLEFTEEGLVLTSLQQRFDTSLNAWINTVFITNTYDEEMELIEQLSEKWNEGTESWDLDRRVINTINEEGQVEMVNNQIYTNDWVNENRTLFFYEEDGDNDELRFENWDTLANDWVPAWQIFNAFNGENQLSASLFQLYNVDQGTYINGNQSFFTYNGEGYKTEELRKLWNETEQSFLNSSKVNFDYNEEGLQTEAITEVWNLVDSIWGNQSRVEDVYDGENNTNRITQNWNGTDWQNTFQNIWEYDEDGNLTTFTFFFWQNEEWIEASHCDFFGHEIIINQIEDVESPIECIFPNPIENGGKIWCDWEGDKNLEITLYDINGKLQYFQVANYNLNMTIPENLISGVYFLNIIQEGTLLKKEKIIVR